MPVKNIGDLWLDNIQELKPQNISTGFVKLPCNMLHRKEQRSCKRTTEETLSTLAKFTKGAKAGFKTGLWPNLIVIFSFEVKQAYKQRDNNDISNEQFQHHLVQEVGPSGGYSVLSYC